MNQHIGEFKKIGLETIIVHYERLHRIQFILDYPPQSGPDKCWRIIERDDESRPTELQKSVPMDLMVDSEIFGYQSCG